MKQLTHLRSILKGAGSRNRKQSCYLYDLYCCPHVAIVSCSDFGGWGESTIKLLLKSTNISAILLHMSVWFVSLKNLRVHLQNNTYILRKVVENVCDMYYQKYCKIVVSKEVCLQYVTLTLNIINSSRRNKMQLKHIRHYGT